MNHLSAWWKWLCLLLLLYIIVAGFLLPVPRLNILNETIRNLYFHVPMWFGQVILFTVSIVYGFRYLVSSKNDFEKHALDIYSFSFITVGMLYGILGLLTGMIWGKYTWGTVWSSDPKLNATAIGLLIYLAYFVLRSAIDNIDQRARLAAVYAIFSYVLFIVLIFIIPRMKEFSIHPGNGGNPGFATYDLDSKMRLVFYPAVIGFSLLGVWMSIILAKIIKLKHHLLSISSQ
jgi:heme exporter protein C